MIYFSFSIANPFRYKENAWKYFCRTWKITKNKFFELQLSRTDFYSLFHVSGDFRFVGHDHAGLEIEIGVLNLSFNIQLYDNRHWDYDNHQWEKE